MLGSWFSSPFKWFHWISYADSDIIHTLQFPFPLQISDRKIWSKKALNHTHKVIHCNTSALLLSAAKNQ
jgi:hypothetical protein